MSDIAKRTAEKYLSCLCSKTEFRDITLREFIQSAIDETIENIHKYMIAQGYMDEKAWQQMMENKENE